MLSFVISDMNVKYLYDIMSSTHLNLSVPSPASVVLPVPPVANNTLLWLTAPIILLCLPGKFKKWLTLSSLDRGGVRKGGKWARNETENKILPAWHLPPPSAIFSHPLPLAFFPCSFLFHHLSIPVIPFSPSKSVLIANHHGPAKWQIILHSFITKPYSSYFVSQHVQYVQLPCSLIQSASQRQPWQISVGSSPPEPQIHHRNIPYFLFKREEEFTYIYEKWCLQGSSFLILSHLIRSASHLKINTNRLIYSTWDMRTTMHE